MLRYRCPITTAWLAVTTVLMLGSDALRQDPILAGERTARRDRVELRVLATARSQGEITACG